MDLGFSLVYFISFYKKITKTVFLCLFFVLIPAVICFSFEADVNQSDSNSLIASIQKTLESSYSVKAANSNFKGAKRDYREGKVDSLTVDKLEVLKEKHKFDLVNELLKKYFRICKLSDQIAIYEIKKGLLLKEIENISYKNKSLSEFGKRIKKQVELIDYEISSIKSKKQRLIEKLNLYFENDLDVGFRSSLNRCISLISEIVKVVDIPKGGFSYKLKQIEKKQVQKKADDRLKGTLTEIKNYELDRELFCIENDIKKYHSDIYYYMQIKDVFKQIIDITDDIKDIAFGAVELAQIRKDYIYGLSEINDLKWKTIDRKLKLFSLGEPVDIKIKPPDLEDGKLPLLKEVVNLALENVSSIKTDRLVYDTVNELKAYHRRYLPSEFLNFSDLYSRYRQLKIKGTEDEVASRTIVRWYKLLFVEKTLKKSKGILQDYKDRIDILQANKTDEFKMLNSKLVYLKQLINFKQKQKYFFESFINLENVIQSNINIKTINKTGNNDMLFSSKIKNEINKVYQFNKGINKKIAYLERRIIKTTKALADKSFWIGLDFYNNKNFEDINKKIGLSGLAYCKDMGLYQVIKLSDKNKKVAVEIQNMVQNKLNSKNKIRKIRSYNNYLSDLYNLHYSEKLLDKSVDRVFKTKEKRNEIQSELWDLKHDSLDLLHRTVKHAEKKENYYKYLVVYIKDLIEILKSDNILKSKKSSDVKIIHLDKLTGLNRKDEFLEFPQSKLLNIEVNTADDVLKDIKKGFSRLKQKQLPHILQRQRLQDEIKLGYLSSKLKVLKLSILKFNEVYDFTDDLFSFVKKQYEFGIVNFEQVEDIERMMFYIRDKIFNAEREYNDVKTKIKNLVGLDENYKLKISNSELNQSETYIVKIKEIDRFMQSAINNDPDFEIGYLKMGYFSLGELTSFKLSSSLKTHVETDAALMQVRERVDKLERKIRMLQVNVNSGVDVLRVLDANISKNIDFLSKSLEDYKKGKILLDSGYGIKSSILNLCFLLNSYYEEYLQYKTAQKELLQLAELYSQWPEGIRVQKISFGIPALSMYEKKDDKIEGLIKYALSFFVGDNGFKSKKSVYFASLFMRIDISKIVKKVQSVFLNILGKFKEIFLKFKNKFIVFPKEQKKRDERRDYWKQQISKRLELAYERKKNRQQNLKEYRNMKLDFDKAQNREYMMTVFLNKWWKELKKENAVIRDILNEYKILLNSKPKSVVDNLKEFVLLSEIEVPFYYREQLVITQEALSGVFGKIIDNYLDRFRLYTVDEDEFVENFILVVKELNKEIDCKKCLNIPSFYRTYVWNMLSPQIKAMVRRKVDFDYLGLALFYTHLISYCQQDEQCLDILHQTTNKTLENLKVICLKNRIKNDLKYMKMDIEDASLEEIKEYLRWKRYCEFQFSEVIFSDISRLKIIKAHRIMQDKDFPWLKMTYGDLELKYFQENVYRWLLSKGFNLEELSNVLKVLDVVYANIVEFYPEPTIGQAVKDSEQILLKSLIEQQGKMNFEKFTGIENYLVDSGFNLFRKSYLYGNLMSLSNFVLDNNIENIRLLFDFMVYIKELDSFKSIFGEVLLSNPNSKFYQSILINSAQEVLDLLKEKDISKKSLVDLKKYISDKIRIMDALHNSKGFSNIYGDFNLKIPYVDNYSDKEIDIYLGKLSFHTRWALKLGLGEEYIKDYFRNLSVFVKPDMRQKLYDFYNKLNIKVDLNLNQPNDELREEVLGIYQSWLNFFNLRGFRSVKELENGLDLINFIAKLNAKYKLGFNQDQIKYWFARKFKEGYSNDMLQEIFCNINKAKYIFKVSGQKLIKELKESGLSDNLTEKNCSKLIKNINILSNQIIPSGEAQRLAEQVMFKSGVNYKGLFKDYSLGMYIQANYMVFEGNKLPPAELTKRVDMFKQCGFDKYLIKKFVKLSVFMAKKEDDFVKELSPSVAKKYPRMTDSEISGFLINLFNKQANEYYKWIDRWWNNVEFVQKEFYAEHGDFLDFAVLTSLVDYDLMRKKRWQIKGIISQGILSKESENVNFINLNKDLNMERNFLRWNLITNWEILSKKQLDEYKKAYKIVDSSGFAEGIQRKMLKKTIEKTSLFKMKLMEILNNALEEEKYFNKKYMRKIDFVTDEISRQFTLPILKWIQDDKTAENMKRREMRLEKQKKILKDRKTVVNENNKFSNILDSVKKRRKIKNLLYSRAKKLYKIELSPSNISSLIWKLQEGYDVSQVLEIYVQLYNKITKLYKNVFDVSTVTVYDNHLILYFSEQTGLNFLNWENMVSMFKLAAKIRNSLKEVLQINISIEESLNYVYKLFYSGATLKTIDSIINEVRVIKHILENNFPVKIVYKKHGDFLDDREVNLEEIIYLVTDMKDIEFQIASFTNVYDFKDYIEEIQNGINEYGLKKYWNNKEVILEIAKRLESSNLSPGWWRLVLYKGLVVDNFIEEQIKTDTALGNVVIYLDYEWPEVFHRLNLYQLRPWYLGRMIGRIKIFKIEELVNKAFKRYLENRIDKK